MYKHKAKMKMTILMKASLEEMYRVRSENCRKRESVHSLENLPSPKGQQLKAQRPTVGESWANSSLSLCKLSLLIQQVFDEHLPCDAYTPF